jgi:hypothetical protein
MQGMCRLNPAINILNYVAGCHVCFRWFVKSKRKFINNLSEATVQ